MSLQPIIEKLEGLFSKLNEGYYGGELETPIITIQQGVKKTPVLGWCTTYKAWQGASEQYEINICAEFLNRPIIDVGETMLHEMVHLYARQHDIQDVSRGGAYHNKRYKEIAESHGLICEKGNHGWNKTGLRPESQSFLQGIFPGDDDILLHRMRFLGGSKKKPSNSRKYVCSECGASVRATKEVNIMCADCDEQMREE